MVQPAGPLLRNDWTRSYGTNPAVRCPLLKAEMRSVLMLVKNIRCEQSLQMAFIHSDHVVQQISPAASHPALRDAILPGRLRCGQNLSNAEPSCRFTELFSVASASIPWQIARRAIPWECFEQLASYPFRRGIFRHGHMDKPTPIV